jgi:hypothetical protein
MFQEWGEKSSATFKGIVESLITVTNWVRTHLDTLLKWGKILLWIYGIWKLINWTIAISSAVTTFYNITVRRANASLFVMNKRLFGVSAASGVYSGMMGVATLATKIFTGSIKALGMAIYSIPIIGWIAAGITAVITLFTILWEKSETFRGIIYGVWEVIKLVFGWMGTTANWIYTNIIRPVFDGVVNIFF